MRVTLPQITVNPVWIAALVAILPSGILIYHLGVPLVWPTLIIPASVAVFSLIWARVLTSRTSWSGWASATALWVVGVHLAVWLLFVLVAYLNGNGLENLGQSIFNAVFTSVVIAWYTMINYLWPTLIMGVVLALFLIAVSRRSS
ncbi:MAG: hypothetical protein GY945_03045 [Rhodobacteraceae bacterium]|nr:hypothetical protein [Paracoccaceae bacterium]